MEQKFADIQRLKLDLKIGDEENIKKDLSQLVDDIFGVGKYIIIKLEGDKHE